MSLPEGSAEGLKKSRQALGRKKVSIRVSLWDAGCLGPVLSKQIADLDRHARATWADMNAGQRENYYIFRAQLEGCLAGVSAALGLRITG